LLLVEAEEARVRNDCKLIDEPIRWREQAFHWPRIILSFFIIYGAIALGIYATYRAYRYVTAVSVDSRQSFHTLEHRLS
jgi:hypothetical protein